MLHGSDGVARAALVNVANRSESPKVLEQSVRHLINDADEDKEMTAKNVTTATNDVPRSEASSTWSY